MVLADTLSRTSLKDADPKIPDEELAAQTGMVYSNSEITGTNLEEIRRLTTDDRVLSELR